MIWHMAYAFNECELESAAIRKLIDAGYPKDAIVAGWRSKNHRIDIVVFDESTKIPLMFVECKSIREQYDYAALVRSLRNLSKCFDCPVRAFVAFAGKSGVDFYDFTDEVSDDSRLASDFKPVSVPSYDTLRIGAENKYINAQKEKRKTYVTGLKVVCWIIIPLLIIALFLLDALSCYHLTTERLILFGGLLLSILLPFFGEIKVGEITLSNKKKNKD